MSDDTTKTYDVGTAATALADKIKEHIPEEAEEAAEETEATEETVDSTDENSEDTKDTKDAEESEESEDAEDAEEAEDADDDEESEDDDDSEESEDDDKSEDDEDSDVIQLTDDVSVTRQEAIDAIHGMGDYTKKTQKLAEERREIGKVREAMELVTTTALAELAPELEKYNELSEQQWASLLEKDPQSYQQHRARYNQLNQQQSAIADKVKELRGELSKVQEKELQEAQDSAVETLQTLEPGFDEKRYDQIAKYAEDNGVKKEVFNAILDPYLLNLISKAEKISKASTSTPKAKVKKTKTPTPTATRTKAGKTKLAKNLEAFRSKGGGMLEAQNLIAQSIRSNTRK